MGGPAKSPFKEAAKRCTNYGLAGGPDAQENDEKVVLERAVDAHAHSGSAGPVAGSCSQGC